MSARRMAVEARPPMRDRRSQLAIAAVAFVLGLLVVVQLRTQTGGSALQGKSAQDLTNLIGSVSTENDRLRSEVTSLQNQLEELRADRANGATSIGQIQSDLGRIRAWTGLDPVAGRGVTITVSGVPGSLDVDGFLLRDPFTIRAIGRPETLVGSLTRAGGIIAQLAATNLNATVDVRPTNDPMTLPATKRNLVPDHGHPRL